MFNKKNIIFQIAETKLPEEWSVIVKTNKKKKNKTEGKMCSKKIMRKIVIQQKQNQMKNFCVK